MPKRKIAFIVGGVVLVAFALIMSRDELSRGGRKKLPIGAGKPAISLGETHGIILASNGSLWSWGSDFLGWPVLGRGSNTAQIHLRQVGTDTNWLSISTSDVHVLAIRADGTLWAWGENIFGQFGLGLSGKALPHTNVPAPAVPGHDWKQAAAGGCFSVALKTNGTLWAWGNNWAGPLGIGTTSNSASPVQVGVVSNWTRIWAGRLETLAQQSDGSLWYCGQSLNSGGSQTVGQILVPTRVSPDTNWVDVGFGEATVFGTKSDGTLWAWGRNANVFTGVNNTALNVTPVRVGTNSDWQSIAASGWWWCLGLTKKDGSLWFLDASDGQPNGPRPPYKPVIFRRVETPGEIVAFTAGSAHAPAPGDHVPVGVMLTRDGEVWTWGMVLGDPSSPGGDLKAFGNKVAKALNLKEPFGPPGPVVRGKPWQLPNDPD